MPNIRLLGRYEIKQMLGHGSMGCVYLAQDPLLQRQVAIKTLQGVAEDHQTTRERFRREAEISALLNHPNIITVFDVGEDPEAGPFLAMEYVAGNTLARRIREGLALDIGFNLLVQGVGALRAIASAGIVHRDIKPDNVLVSLDNRFKLMDFGIARMEGSRLTQSGTVLGTPAYTAPEVLLGGEPTSATDGYAFAATAFEVLTGTVPFQASSIGATLYKIVHEELEIPTGMSPQVWSVFSRAFAKNPANRYPDPAAFVRDLLGAAPMNEELRSRLLTRLEGDEVREDTHSYPPSLVARSQFMPEEQTTLPISGKARVRSDGSLVDPTPQEVPSLQPEPEAGELVSMEVPDLQAENDQAPRRRRGLGTWLAVATGIAILGFVLSGYLRSTLYRRMDVLSIPEGAEVFLDGSAIGRTPLRGVQVSKKAGSMQFRATGFLTFDAELAANTTRVEVELTPEPYPIRVTTDPPGAEVYLNGGLAGKSPIAALLIPARGPNQIKIHLDGFQDWTASLEKEIDFPELILLNPAPRK